MVHLDVQNVGRILDRGLAVPRPRQGWLAAEGRLHLSALGNRRVLPAGLYRPPLTDEKAATVLEF